MPRGFPDGIAVQIDDGDFELPIKICKILEDAINNAVPPGIKATIALENEEAYMKWFKNRDKAAGLSHLPDVMRRNFVDMMSQRLSDVGAVFEGVEFDGYRFAPLVTYRYQGEEYQVFFYLDGEFFEGKGWRLENADEHTFTSIITRSIPEEKRRHRQAD